jgi:hypothetical protein
MSIRGVRALAVAIPAGCVVAAAPAAGATVRADAATTLSVTASTNLEHGRSVTVIGFTNTPYEQLNTTAITLVPRSS